MIARKGTVVEAVGDVVILERRPDLVFAGVQDVLRDCDVLFGNCETVYQLPDKLEAEHQCGPDCQVGTLQRAGFDVMSCANNHAGDHGRDALLHTLALLRRHQITTCGAGPTPDEARRLGVVRGNGKTVGFLAYTGVRDPHGRADIPEIANLHAEVSYLNVEPNQPGTPPKIVTRADEGDLRDILDNVRRSRREVDLLFVSFHWGVHNIPYVIADYEREVAHSVIDAGADGVIGHHQHLLKPIEIYRDRPIFYGLGNFASYVSPEAEPISGDPRYGENRGKRYPGWWSLRPPRHRMTVIARCEFFDNGPPSVELIPCKFDQVNRPLAFAPKSATGKRVLAYLREANDIAEIMTTFQVRGTSIAALSASPAEVPA
jgi:poly-gamma-glutamate synthesis protein (capsule biosynthesis protein)